MTDQPASTPSARSSAGALGAPAEPLLSPVWVLRGLANDPGYLVAAQGRVVLTTGESGGPAFDVGLHELVDVQWPWWWFGGGFKATVRGTRHKLSFVRPNDAAGPDAGLLSLVDPDLWGSSGHSLRGLADVVAGRAQAKRWREVVTPS